MAVSTTTKPVTQVAEVAVNKASMKRNLFPGFTIKGKSRANVPLKMMIIKPKSIEVAAENLSALLCTFSQRESGSLPRIRPLYQPSQRERKTP